MSPRVRLLSFVFAALLVLAGPASAVMPGPIVGTIGPGWFGTNNVNLDLNIPINSGSAGARAVGDQLFITEQNGLTVYDISDPALPVPQGFVSIPQSYYFTEEDVPTNGEIALVGQLGSASLRLNVVDVSLEDNLGGQPVVIGTLSGVDEHTFECGRDCTYAYGSDGVIGDLTDPTDPRTAGNWRDAVASQTDPRSGESYRRPGNTHDVTEVVPGILLTSTVPMYLLDIRATPTAPQVIGVATFPDNRFIHANLWPYHGELPDDPADPAAEGWEPDWAAFDEFVLVGGETAPLVIGGACDEADGAFMTMPWTRVDADGDGAQDFVEMSFDPAAGLGDEYRPEPGTFTDGGSPYSQFCSHWFTTAPDFRDGGLLSVGWYEFGVRFLEIGDGGAIKERGWLIPMGGSTSAAYWLDETTIYTADYQRGIDILSFDKTIPPSETEEVVVHGTRFERAVLPRPQWVEDWYTGFGCPLPS